MDQKIALLSSLYFLSTHQQSFSDEDMRRIRILLSRFIEDIIAEDDYQLLVDLLKDEGYIQQNKASWSMKREG